ncbi:hypothetical protein HXX76_004467 [Chlamydomonas incerta]|uniref:BTB domain-containing protein n=1 Tax=Chlamydomonas incerta TaxID=51695 RepID=A0A835T7I9_CHLIN|nr:hypothetical protein HXX76_004467 [Chlamydomonas incerta]|eukprot:KAG2440362.1 hypothetical protein HXX76_004467 [Chlamydomonas incerta]
MALLASCTAHHTSLVRPAAAVNARVLPRLLRCPMARRVSAQSATSSPAPPEKLPAVAVAPCACLVSLTFGQRGNTQQEEQQQKQLQVDCALLWHASPVLRPQIDAICSSAHAGLSAGCPGGAATAPAALQLEGTAADWAALLNLLQHTGEFPVVQWDNVVPLLRLADKYDMTAVRKECAQFLVTHVKDISLAAPLESPQNLLHAASLVETYLSGSSTPAQRAVQQLVAPIGSVLREQLYAVDSQFISTSMQAFLQAWKSKARDVVANLNRLVNHPQYQNIVTVAVQDMVTKAVTASLWRLASNI